MKHVSGHPAPYFGLISGTRAICCGWAGSLACRQTRCQSTQGGRLDLIQELAYLQQFRLRQCCSAVAGKLRQPPDTTRSRYFFFFGSFFRFVFAMSRNCFSDIDSTICFEAPLRLDFLRSPRLAASAAPAAICCFFDFAGILFNRHPLRRRTYCALEHRFGAATAFSEGMA